MARSRNIKPGLFKNEDLAECSIWARYIFPGLWCIADRAGRLEDRPKRIKGELLAFDSVDVEPLLAELTAYGFIARYEVDGKRVIQILTFCKHQNPHFREQDSELPAMPGWQDPEPIAEKPEAQGSSKVPKARGKPEASPPLQPTEASDKPEASPRLSTHESDLQRGSSPADSLISDSLIPELIPDPNGSLSASPPSERQPSLDGLETEPPVDQRPKLATVPPCPYDRLLDAYAEVLPMLPQPRRSLFREGENATAMRQRWAWVLTENRESGDLAGQRMATNTDEGVAWFRRFFEYVATCPHLVGGNGGRWTSSLGWLVKKGNFEKVVEGNYHPDEQRESAHA